MSSSARPDVAASPAAARLRAVELVEAPSLRAVDGGAHVALGLAAAGRPGIAAGEPHGHPP
eukprot:2774602-Pyramimonas_sp.AAC.1